MTENNTGGQLRKVVLACMIGSTIEWYEFFIYGTAASMVFSELFFPSFDPLVGTLLALLTFAVAFAARPIGGIVFGQLGDRIGRKGSLILTLTLMGGSTFAVGLLPTYDAVGTAAPILLVLCRLVQGFSVGGELSGAVLMSVEHAQQARRGLFGALVNSGIGCGLLLANAVFLPLTLLPAGAFTSWGWRVPFLFSIVLVGVGLFIRLRIEESPEFERLKSTGRLRKTPALDVLREHAPGVFLLALGTVCGGVAFYAGGVFSVAYGTKQLGLGSDTMLTLVLISTAVVVVATPSFGWVADRVGHKKVFQLGVVGMMIAPFAWFPLMNTQQFGLMLLGFIALFVPFAANFGAIPAFFAHVFPPDVRFSGMAIGYNVGTLLGSAVAPIVATWLLAETGSWTAVATYMSACGAITLTAAAFLRDYRDRRPTVDLTTPAMASGTTNA